MELIIALVLFSMVVLGVYNIEGFSKFVFMSSDRKAKTINEAGFVLEHMSKFIGKAVGDANNTPLVIDSPPAYCTKAVQAWIDNASGFDNGVWDATDRQIMYCFDNTSHNLVYYPNYTLALPGQSEVLSRNIADLIMNISRNSLDVNITGCWNASITSGSGACGSLSNPKITVQTRIFMPSVSINASQ